MQAFIKWLITGWLLLVPAFPLFAQEPSHSESPANYLFRNQFFLSPSQKLHYNTTQAENLLLIEQPSPELGSNVAIVSGFAPHALRTRVLKGVQSVDQAKEWIRKQKKDLSFEGVSITELPLSTAGDPKAYWVGQRSFASYDQAAAEVAMIKTVTEIQGGSFDRALQLSGEFIEREEVPPVKEVKTQAQFQKEEEIALRWIDQLSIGDSLYGPFQGVSAGEPILYQSFGESSYRTTNLAERKFNAVVGFWTNRLVFKGIRFPFNTVDPFVELTGALDSTGNEGGSQLDTSFGAEWRPLERNAWLQNFRPWGIPLLIWARNYRFFVQYFDRRNLKDEIANIRDFDLRFGVSIFYEWGVDLPPIGQQRGEGVVGFLTDYVWGEYFGEYAWRDTNFTAEEDFDAWILDSSLILGLKTPAIKLPANSMNDELVLMPYVRFALTSNTRLSNPSDNRYYVSVGLRWMPFRSYQFVNNEWLFKTKIFAEYLAIGKVQNLKQDDSLPQPDEDWRIGLSFSLRRF